MEGSRKWSAQGPALALGGPVYSNIFCWGGGAVRGIIYIAKYIIYIAKFYLLGSRRGRFPIPLPRTPPTFRTLDKIFNNTVRGIIYTAKHIIIYIAKFLFCWGGGGDVLTVP